MGSWQRLLLLGGVSLRGCGGACAALGGSRVLVCRRQVRGAAGQREGGTEVLERQVPWHCLLLKYLVGPRSFGGSVRPQLTGRPHFPGRTP